MANRWAPRRQRARRKPSCRSAGPNRGASSIGPPSACTSIRASHLVVTKSARERNSASLAQTPPGSSSLVQLRIGSSTMILRALMCLSLFLVAALPAEAAQRQRAHGLSGTKVWRDSVPRPPRSIPGVARPPAASARSQPQSAVPGQPSAPLSTQNKEIPPGREFPSTQTPHQPSAAAGPALPPPAMSPPATISSDTGFTPVQGFE
jgi:hypothetical protein